MKIRYEYIKEPSGNTEYSGVIELKTVQDFKKLLYDLYDNYYVAIDSISDDEGDSTAE